MRKRGEERRKRDREKRREIGENLKWVGGKERVGIFACGSLKRSAHENRFIFACGPLIGK
jgi:hypothetical protein